MIWLRYRSFTLFLLAFNFYLLFSLLFFFFNFISFSLLVSLLLNNNKNLGEGKLCRPHNNAEKIANPDFHFFGLSIRWNGIKLIYIYIYIHVCDSIGFRSSLSLLASLGFCFNFRSRKCLMLAHCRTRYNYTSTANYLTTSLSIPIISIQQC